MKRHVCRSAGLACSLIHSDSCARCKLNLFALSCMIRVKCHYAAYGGMYHLGIFIFGIDDTGRWYNCILLCDFVYSCSAVRGIFLPLPTTIDEGGNRCFVCGASTH